MLMSNYNWPQNRSKPDKKNNFLWFFQIIIFKKANEKKMVLYKRKIFIQNQDHIWSRYHSGNWISRSWKKEKTRIFRNLRRRIHDPVFEFFTVFLWTVISIGEIWFCWNIFFLYSLLSMLVCRIVSWIFC